MKGARLRSPSWVLEGEILFESDLEVLPDPALGWRLRVRDRTVEELSLNVWNDWDAYAGAGRRQLPEKSSPEE